MTGAREPRVCRDRGFDYAESFHLDQCRNEAIRAIEKLYVRNAFTFEEAIGATGVTDVFTGEFFPRR